MATIDEKSLREELAQIKQREKEINDLLKNNQDKITITVSILSKNQFQKYILSGTLNNTVLVRNQNTFHFQFLYNGNTYVNHERIFCLNSAQDNNKSNNIRRSTSLNNINIINSNRYLATIDTEYYVNKANSSDIEFRGAPYVYGIIGFHPNIEYKDD